MVSARDSWPSKIKQLRDSLGLSQEQLARRLEVTKKTIAEWEQARQVPSAERALQLARLAAPGELRRWLIRQALDRIGADEGLLEDALGARRRGRQAPLPVAGLRVIPSADLSDRFRALEGLSDFVPIPLLRDAAAAGSPREISEEDIEGYAMIQYAWCPNPAEFTCVRVRGASMSPILLDGAVVAIDHLQRDPQALHQKMVAARVEDGVTIKWLNLQPDGSLLLVPENKNYPAIPLPRTPTNPIVGLVAWWWNRQR
ncbi:MAG TPA: XRE family transcriptional regulator [Candidatus Xenobia bacterium]|nr:XRE family transcriptional regulator [Candidatus Xenobia bacterium]